jgi:hypothetical protein
MKNVFKNILLVTSFFTLFNCSGAGNNDSTDNIIILEQYSNKTYTEMIELLGPPIDKTAYTIEHAPTKGWNHLELFSKYSKIPENYKIQIMEVTWNDGDYFILACFHMADGENRCLVSKRILKGVEF